MKASKSSGKRTFATVGFGSDADQPLYTPRAVIYLSREASENFDFMFVIRVEHVQLAMPEGGEPRAREFYQGALGIPEVPKPPHLAKRGGCWFERGDLKIHLGVEVEFRPARKAHPALLIEGLPVLVATLRAMGYAVHEDEALLDYNRVYVDDPFGNRIELMEPRSSEA